MKTKTTGRVYIGVPISFKPSEKKYLDKRVLELGPRIASRSQYIQVLVEMDRECDLVGQGLAIVQARMLAGKKR